MSTTQARTDAPPVPTSTTGTPVRRYPLGWLRGVAALVVVVFHGSSGRTGFEVGFPLRCFQRLSLPYIATLQCGWRHNRSTRGTSIPVLSY